MAVRVQTVLEGSESATEGCSFRESPEASPAADAIETLPSLSRDKSRAASASLAVPGLPSLWVWDPRRKRADSLSGSGLASGWQPASPLAFSLNTFFEGGGEFLAQIFLKGFKLGELDVVFQITILLEILFPNFTVSCKVCKLALFIFVYILTDYT